MSEEKKTISKRTQYSECKADKQLSHTINEPRKLLQLQVGMQETAFMSVQDICSTVVSHFIHTIIYSTLTCGKWFVCYAISCECIVNGFHFFEAVKWPERCETRERAQRKINMREYISSTLYKNFGWATLKVKVTVCSQLFRLSYFLCWVQLQQCHTQTVLRLPFNKNTRNYWRLFFLSLSFSFH